MLIRKFLIAATCAMTLSVLGGQSACADSAPALFLGNDNIKPFLFIDENQNSGLVADIFTEISDRTDKDISLKLMDWSDAQSLVKNKKAIGMVQLNRNADREKYLDFSVPLLTSEFFIFHRRANAELQDLKSLAGKIVGVEGAGFPISLIKDHPEIKVQILNSWADGFELLDDGKIDAVIVDRWVGEYALANTHVRGIETSVRPLVSLVSYIAVLKEHADLLVEINNAIEDMRADGTFDRIVKKWIFKEVIYITENDKLVNDVILGFFIFGFLVTVALVLFIVKLRRLQRELEKERLLLEEKVAQRTEALSQTVVSEQKLREEAEAANKAKSEFLATISHEMRTPISGVIGLSDLILEEAIPDKVREYVEKSRSAAKGLITILNEVLDMSRLQANKIQIEKRASDPREILTSIIDFFAERADYKGIGLHSQVAHNVPELLVTDPQRLRQVLLNLVGNAIKFTSTGAVNVNLSFAQTGNAAGNLNFVVSDTGIGIPNEKLNEIFEEFVQVDGSTSRMYGGTGLGLAISQRFTQLLGGDISVVSELGQGSTFTISIPCAVERQVSQPTAVTLKVFGETFSDKTLLIADDDDLMRKIAAAKLKKYFAEVKTAVNGMEAVKHVQEGNVDFVIMDIRMPEMDGIEATRSIRAISAISGAVPIFGWTADIATAREEECYQAGMTDVMTKPLDFDDFLGRAGKLIA